MISSIFHPSVITASLLSSFIFISWFTFWNTTKLARTERERAYVCTLLSSSVTSLSSLPLVYQFLKNGGDFPEFMLAYQSSHWPVFVTTFFMTFLFLDLTMGSYFYANKIELLTGWIHHITYLLTLIWAIHQGYCAIFIMMCSLELPTFLLALGSVRSKFRRDYLFATAFLLTRILFHAFTICRAWIAANSNPGAYQSILIALSSFFPVHCYWFFGFIKQQVRLANKKREKLVAASNHNLIKHSNKVKINVVTKSPSNGIQSTASRLVKNTLTTTTMLIQRTVPSTSTITTHKRQNNTNLHEFASSSSSSDNNNKSTAYITSSSFHQSSPPVSVH
ncbi:MAG: hypothetical protein EXX96DRAFT_566026 [Benjaminiella poitrasii]|nr:MAG: hypothetical protein EXX96DRAFT_566026 [Benjaminiella poitrasii]